MLYVHRILPAQVERRTRDTFRAFSRAVELRFPSHDGLTDDVVDLCGKVARKIGMSRKRTLRLEMAAQLRDIGLCAIPYRLVNEKPVLRWTDEDRTTNYRHQEVSATMLRWFPSLSHLAPIVRCHHTNFDGISPRAPLPRPGDIPRGQGGSNSLVLYLAERWSGPMLARTWIEQGAGTEYDPQIVEAFWQVLTSSRAVQPAKCRPRAFNALIGAGLFFSAPAEAHGHRLGRRTSCTTRSPPRRADQLHLCAAGRALPARFRAGFYNYGTLYLTVPASPACDEGIWG